MDRSKLELDRCILFPRVKEAVVAIENMEIDSRYEIEVIDLTYDLLSKLELFGFFSYPKGIELSIKKNSFIKLPAIHILEAIETALKARKQTDSKELTRIIDKFVEKAKHSEKQGLPIWFNT